MNSRTADNIILKEIFKRRALFGNQTVVLLIPSSIQANSKGEAVEWAKRCPAQSGDVIEARQVFEMTDFPPDVQKAADNPTVKAQVEKHKN